MLKIPQTAKLSNANIFKEANSEQMLINTVVREKLVTSHILLERRNMRTQIYCARKINGKRGRCRKKIDWIRTSSKPLEFT